MKKAAVLVLVAFALAISAAAQTKISGKQTCGKPDPSYTVDVGDRAGHSMLLQKSTCSWDTPLEIEGTKSKDSADVSSSEGWGMKFTQHGYNMATMDNGDKFTVRYTGTMTAAKDGSATFEGKWVFVSGTGKLKGIKGGGTYKGSGTADGAATVDVEGDYTLSPAASK